MPEKPIDREKITTFFHCKNCMPDMPPGMTRQKWSNIEVGVTDEWALVVRCYRCDLEIIHLECE